ncbi:hypothetical protein X773_33285 [Mesorhizobium sp. LSJC285A00]|uniref:hypothetical protein n=1 Tax=Mesorhizobium sp. LSJC285A00 TaxID=1287338 RepID=UPI0003CEC2E5|nr:hypothetical protein [Mesorhizobium sp. LSJC285A00]ESW63963.1 hypothetical protein X773_33285 [Mesorhizobium sp. LSJC285A00]
MWRSGECSGERSVEGTKRRSDGSRVFPATQTKSIEALERALSDTSRVLADWLAPKYPFWFYIFKPKTGIIDLSIQRWTSAFGSSLGEPVGIDGIPESFCFDQLPEDLAHCDGGNCNLAIPGVGRPPQRQAPSWRAPKMIQMMRWPLPNGVSVP